MMFAHSTLEQHKFKRGKFTTPFNDAFGDKLQLSSWGSERLPEYLWIGLILKKHGRSKGLQKCYWILKKLHDALPNINFPTISNIFTLEDVNQQLFWEFVEHVSGQESLSPLTLIYTYRNYPIFNKIFQTSLDYKEQIHSIEAVLKDAYYHQTEFATDIRFVVLYFELMQGRTHIPKDTFDEICKYPLLEHSDEQMHLIRPLIRSMEIARVNISNCETDKSNLILFWKMVSEMSDCELYTINYETLVENPETYLNYLHEIFTYLDRITATLEPLSTRNIVLCGIATYAYKRICELVDHQLYNEISGRNIIRNIIEDYIMMKYLLKHEKEKPTIWDEYQYYGIGLYKLVMERERSNPCSFKDGHVNYVLLQCLVNEYRDEEFIDIDTSYFDKQNIRLKAKDVGEEELYGLFYDYDSSFEHGLWGAIRESSLLKCDNPAHQFHLVLDSDNEQKLPSVWKDCVRTMNKILMLLNNELSIPTQLLSEVKKFE